MGVMFATRIDSEMLSPAKLQRASALLLVVGVLLLSPVAVYVKEFIAVDVCLDAGGSYDYSTGECDISASHPYVPFSSRRPRVAWMIRFFAPVGGALVVVALTAALVGVTTRRSN